MMTVFLQSRNNNNNNNNNNDVKRNIAMTYSKTRRHSHKKIHIVTIPSRPHSSPMAWLQKGLRLLLIAAGFIVFMRTLKDGSSTLDIFRIISSSKKKAPEYFWPFPSCRQCKRKMEPPKEAKGNQNSTCSQYSTWRGRGQRVGVRIDKKTR